MRKIKIPIEKAVGERIPHDFTKISKEQGYKGAFFKKGHVIEEKDIPLLKSIGKNYIYKLVLNEDEVHEDDFSTALAPKLAGKNIEFDEKPSEGKITFKSKIDGLFKLDRKRVLKLNSISIASFPTIHNNFPVKKGYQVAAFRIIPLVGKRAVLERALSIADEPLIWVEEYKIREAALIVTGSEIRDGLIEDGFEPLIRSKLQSFGVKLAGFSIVGDSLKEIGRAFEEFKEYEFIILTGGSSVDPDDITKRALKRCGVKFLREGNPIQPANNFTIGYLGGQTVCVVPAGALFYRASAFDIFLPRLLAKDRITRREIAEYSIGGLCHFCKVCVYPVCPFGKV